MEKIYRPVWAEIDLDKIEFNIRNIKELAKDKEVIGVIKADAYGHGAIDIAPVLLKNGVSRLAVATLTEAMELRIENITAPIIILGYTPTEFGEDLIKYDIEHTVYTLEDAERFSSIAEDIKGKVKVHIAIDTGMGRIGFLPNEESIEDIVKIDKLKGVDIVGLFTHFSTADEEDKEYTKKQYKVLENFYEELNNRGVNIPFKHAANSATIMDLPNMYLDGVRAGIVMYGYYPSNEVNKGRLKIKPAMTIKAKIAHIKTLEKGAFVSYGRTYEVSESTRVATIPIGYADGYLRALSNKGKVIVNGKLAPVIGRVCMDQLMIDVTHINNVKVDDEVILLGEFDDIKYNADDMANAVGTINYEIICMIKGRVPRVYVKDGKVVEIRNYI